MEQQEKEVRAESRSVAGSGSQQRESPNSKSFSLSTSGSSPASSGLELGVDFLVSPRCYQLYSVALVLEEEVSVMEDVVDHEALERIKRMRREQQAELKALSAAARNARVAALDANRQLMELFPCFDWEAYHRDPNYLQGLILERGDAERQSEQDKVEDIISQNEGEKKYLMAEIDDLREQRAVLQRRLDQGCELDLQEEIDKARRENQLLREHYTHLCALVQQQDAKGPSLNRTSPY